MAGFQGFGASTIAFIAGLSANNSKDWFDAHRAAYDADYIAPAKDFVAAIGPGLQKIAPRVQAEPKVNGSIFRINRDVRFSKDRTPYKDHLDLWFWEGARKGALSGFFFRLTKDRLILGTGAHGFDAPRLAAYRAALADPRAAEALTGSVSAIRGAGLDLGGSHYANPPRGFAPPNDAIAALSRHNALYASLVSGHPKSLGSSAFVDHCLGVFAGAAPLHRWLIGQIG